MTDTTSATKQVAADAFTEQELHVYEIDTIWVVAANAKDALDCALNSNHGGAEIEEAGYQECDLTAIDLDANEMWWDPTTSEEQITYREAVHRHLSERGGVVPAVIAAEDY